MDRNDELEELKSLHVVGLFGRFDHELNFHEQDDVTIITAPNGYGKTVMLRIIDSVFNRKLQFFWKLSFDNIKITFKSGKSISIFKDTSDLFGEEPEKGPRTVSLQSVGFGDDKAIHSLSRKLPTSDLRTFERHFPVDRMGPDNWFDFATEAYFSTDQIIELYADQLPDRLLESLKLPDWLQRVTRSLKTHLVETQRLLSLDESEETKPNFRRKKIQHSSVVEKDAADLSARIGQVLQEYANESQKLDQSFPKRVIAFSQGEARGEGEIRRMLQDLSTLRDDLVSVGLIGKAISDPIRPSDVLDDESIRRILSIYIDDTSSKLGVFDEIYEKIRLFKQILDEHFSFKTISIDATKGIQAIDAVTGDPISLSELSSGEQHELVLVYELLFKVERGAVILIDEPELSLHVAWQKKFISDIQKIQKLSDLKVIIATHSPQIINDKWDLVQELSA